MPDVVTGTMIDGRYEVISRLGAGGMADVFLAEDQQLGRKVALKLLHGRFAEDPDFVERFRREAQAAAGLQHPNVVSVYDRGSYEGTYYIAMEYLPGQTLKALIAEQAPLDPIRAIDITLQILIAARFAHRRGVIHRDLKPQNAIIDDADQVKVTDFGIARAGASDMTETGSIMGTAQYLSPEQAQGQAVSASSDLYSIAVVLYELLTGRVPFDAESAVTIAIKHVSEAPTALTTVNPMIPLELEQVVMWALNKDPADRPADADQLIAALEHVKALIGTGAGPQPTTSMPALILGAAVGTAAAAAEQTPPPSSAALDGEAASGPAGEPSQPPKRGRLSRRRRRVLALALAVLVAGGAIAAYLLTRPAQAVVPAVVGQTVNNARTVAVNAGFSVSVLGVPNGHAAGTVISQQPLGGSRADKGSTVMLTVSQGAGNRTVPAVKGLSVASAEQLIRAAGLSVGPIMHIPSGTFGAGKVADTDPGAGVTPPVGTKVTIFVSSGKSNTGATSMGVPDVSGQTQASAETALQAAGFKVTTSTQPSGTVPAGDVISQSPSGGASAAPGSTVNIVIAQAQAQAPSSGPSTSPTPAPATASVPRVVGSTASAASSTLTRAGFQVSQSPKPVTNQANEGIVLSQSPSPGSIVGKGSMVTIVVGHYTPATPTSPSPSPSPPGR